MSELDEAYINIKIDDKASTVSDGQLNQMCQDK